MLQYVNSPEYINEYIGDPQDIVDPEYFYDVWALNLLILFLVFISLIMPLIWLRWMIKKGTPGPNRFGEDPLQPPQSMNPETESVADTNHPASAGHPSVGGEK